MYDDTSVRMLLLAETWSNENGEYTFPYLEQIEQGYWILAIDNIQPVKPFEIRSHLTPY